jgi:hypothetical protein
LHASFIGALAKHASSVKARDDESISDLFRRQALKFVSHFLSRPRPVSGIRLLLTLSEHFADLIKRDIASPPCTCFCE